MIITIDTEKILKKVKIGGRMIDVLYPINSRKETICAGRRITPWELFFWLVKIVLGMDIQRKPSLRISSTKFYIVSAILITARYK